MKKFVTKFFCIPLALLIFLSVTVYSGCEQDTNIADKQAAPVNKSALQNRYNQYKNFDTSAYTDETAGALITALGAAEAALADEDATQAEVNTALAALNIAIGSLTPKAAPVNKSALQNQYNEYKNFEVIEYTGKTIAAFRAALKAAEEVLDDDDASQVEADSALAALNTAKDNLSYYDESYNPTTFNKNTVQREVKPLGDGVLLVKTTIYRNDGYRSEINTVLINLDKADVAAGGELNGSVLRRLQPLAHMNNWVADHPGRKAMATINGDFYGDTNGDGVYVPVNAFVKEGVILKARHKVTTTDVPKSAPLLFGVKGNKAQIAPMRQYTGDITTSEVKQFVISGEFTYDENGKIKSADGTWDGYTTIVGGRAALIIDGEIPSTVPLEAAATSQNVPRSAVAVKGDNIAILIAVECLMYRAAGNATPEDPRGQSYVQLADFLRYYGVDQAVNMDGGGSTVLIYRDNNGTGPDTLAVRSSDNTGSWTGFNARAIPNTLIAVTR